MMLNVELFTKGMNIIVFEGFSIICDEGGHDTIPENDVVEDKFSNL